MKHTVQLGALRVTQSGGLPMSARLVRIPVRRAA